jgi:serine/threonine protein phosphatase PrpC
MVIGQRGKLKLQTMEHSPVGFAVRAGMLEAEEAIHHEDRHLVSNIVGDPAMHIEVGPTIPLRPRDTVLLSSDGLVDNVHLHEIIELARKGRLEETTDRLANLARSRMSEPQEGHPCKPDDLTFILFRLASARRTGRKRVAHAALEAPDPEGSEQTTGRRPPEKTTEP